MTSLDEQHMGPSVPPELDDLLRGFLDEIQNVLRSQFVGLYLEGSLASGDFDQESDIDFVVVTEQEVSGELFDALQVMHERFNVQTSQRSHNLEGSYISRHALRRYNANNACHPHIEWGVGERLKIVCHDEAWCVHRFILRERGIAILGPAPHTLIDPVSSGELRQAMLKMLEGWATHVRQNPNEIAQQEYQSYTVLSICRILYTLELGDIVSKAKAARWAQETTGARWAGLIDRAWMGRQQPVLPASSEDINQTLEFVSFALASGEKWRTSR